MKRVMFVGVLASMLFAGHAHAEVMADGTISPVGNPAADLVIGTFNQLRKAVNLEMEYTRFIEQRADILVALQKKTRDAGKAIEKVTKLKANLLTEENAALKLRNSEVSAARGDKAAEAAAEAQYTARKEQLAKAALSIDTAAQEMKRAHDIGEQLRVNLEAVDTRDQVNGTKQWAEVRKQQVTMQAKMTETTKRFEVAMTDAAAALKKGSTVKQGELAGAFKVKLKLTGSKTELWINGAEVKNDGELAVGKDGKILLRAEIVDARRKQARTFKGKTQQGSISITAADDYNLSYSNGTRTSTWSVEKEIYEWKDPEARSGKLGVVRKSSGSGPKGDVLEITIPGDTYSDTIRGFVTGEIAWKGPSVDSDAEGVQYELQIMPAK
jgi:hypothetical protein